MQSSLRHFKMMDLGLRFLHTPILCLHGGGEKLKHLWKLTVNHQKLHEYKRPWQRDWLLVFMRTVISTGNKCKCWAKQDMSGSSRFPGCVRFPGLNNWAFRSCHTKVCHQLHLAQSGSCQTGCSDFSSMPTASLFKWKTSLGIHLS